MNAFMNLHSVYNAAGPDDVTTSETKRMIAHLARPEHHTMWDEDVTQAMAKDTLARWTALEDNPRVIFRFDQHDETAYEALKAVIGCRAAGRSVATLTA